MRANFVGRSVVSAMTQTPASGPLRAGDDAADVVAVEWNGVGGPLPSASLTLNDRLDSGKPECHNACAQPCCCFHCSSLV